MTEDAYLVRYRRNREIDQVAIGLGLAYNTPQHGICYWHAHAADAFRKGYEAGLANARQDAENISKAASKTAALKARVSELEAELAAIGAGGVESLRKKAGT